MPNDRNPGWTRFYVPEIHDIHPAMQAELAVMSALWPAPARERCALLVVPFWMGELALADHPDFCAALAAMPGEKVLHGWTHTLGPDLWNWLLYGHDNRSEFARLSADEARKRIVDGVGALENAAGVRPRWFCAPRWQQSAAVAPVLKEAGFTGYMLKSQLVRFGEEPVPLPALCFDEGPRKTKAALLRRLRERTIDRLVSAGRPFRVTLHPDDVNDAPTWDQVTRLMARLEREGWEPLSAGEAIARWRALQGARQPA